MLTTWPERSWMCFQEATSWHAIDHYYDTSVEYKRVVEPDGDIRVLTYYVNKDEGWSSRGTGGLVAALKTGTALVIT